jgi:hypothetical protein
MADTENAFALRAWSIATFHTVSFVASVVVGVHVSGSLAAALGRLNTQVGVAFFLALWAITWYATRAGLRHMGPRVDDASSETIVYSTTVAGGWNGVGIFALILLVFLVGSLFSLASHAPVGVTLVPVLFFVAVLGGALAFTTGAVVGLVYGVIDALLLRCGAALFRWAQTDLA